jgi:apolipoprotein N-acyltransferase
MSRIRILLLAVLSGLLLPLALPNELFPWGNPALGLVAIAPLYVALASTTGYGMAFLATAIFGGLAHGLSSYWLWFFKDFRYWTLGSSTLAYMVVYGCLGLYLRGALKRSGLYRTLVFAAVWTVFEWGKSNGFLGYPWGLLTYSWNTVLPAIQIAESTGVYGPGFALALVSGGLAEVLMPQQAVLTPPAQDEGPTGLAARLLPPLPSGRGSWIAGSGPLVVAVLLMAGIVGYGCLALAKPREPRGSFTAVLVQQNIDSWESAGGEEEALSISVALANAAIEAAGRKPDIILFSETSLRRPWEEFRSFYARTPREDPLIPFLARTGAWLFTGLPEILDWDTYEASNSVVLINPQGQQVASYAKMHPVPFAEALPFWEYEGFRSFIQNVVGLESGWVMGTERVIFELPTSGAGLVKFAGPICFEDAFAYLCRRFVNDGAELFINLTNDSWSKTNSAEIQHFVAARFRSVEARRVLVRSTNGGVSGIVMPDGSVRDLLPLFTAEARLVDIPVYTGETTPYMLFGDWFVATLALLLAGLLVLVVVGDLMARSSATKTAQSISPFHYEDEKAILESEAPITMQAEDSDERT